MARDSLSLLSLDEEIQIVEQQIAVLESKRHRWNERDHAGQVEYDSLTKELSRLKAKKTPA